MSCRFAASSAGSCPTRSSNSSVPLLCVRKLPRAASRELGVGSGEPNILRLLTSSHPNTPSLVIRGGCGGRRNWLRNTHAVCGDDDQNPKHHDEQGHQDDG